MPYKWKKEAAIIKEKFGVPQRDHRAIELYSRSNIDNAVSRVQEMRYNRFLKSILRTSGKSRISG